MKLLLRSGGTMLFLLFLSLPCAHAVFLEWDSFEPEIGLDSVEITGYAIDQYGYHHLAVEKNESVFYVTDAGGSWTTTLLYESRFFGMSSIGFSQARVTISGDLVFVTCSQTESIPLLNEHTLQCDVFKNGRAVGGYTRENLSTAQYGVCLADGGGIWILPMEGSLIKLVPPSDLADPFASEEFGISFPPSTVVDSVEPISIDAPGPDRLHIILTTASVALGGGEDVYDYAVLHLDYQPSTLQSTLKTLVSGTAELPTGSPTNGLSIVTDSTASPISMFNLLDPAVSGLKYAELLPNGIWDVGILGTQQANFEMVRNQDGLIFACYQLADGPTEELEVFVRSSVTVTVCHNTAARLGALHLAVDPRGNYFVAGIDQSDNKLKVFYHYDLSNTGTIGLNRLEDDALHGRLSDASLPAVALVEEGGMTYMELRYQRPSGGETLAPNQHYFAERDILYEVETSTDLVNWTPDPSLITESVPFSVFGSDTVWVRLNAALVDGQQVYMRLSVKRGK